MYLYCINIYIFGVNAHRFLIDGNVLMLLTRGSQRYQCGLQSWKRLYRIGRFKKQSRV